MPPHSRFLRHLENELPQWVSEGLVSQEQADVLRDRYARGMPAHAWTGGLVATISTLGAVLLGVGAILFFAANWQVIPRFGKLVLLLAGVTLTESVGYVLRDVRRSVPRIGEALVLVGALLYGAGIFLTAQMYHVDASRPVWLLVWVLPLLPLSYILNARSILGLSVLLLFVWAAWDAVDVTTRPGTAVATTLLTITALGATFDGVGHLHNLWPVRQVFSVLYRRLGLLAVTGVVYLLSFRFVYDVAGDPSWDAASRLPVWAVFAVMVLVGVIITRRSSGVAVAQACGILLILAAAAGILFWGAGRETVQTVSGNLLLAAFILSLIVIGYRTREAWLVNAGVVLFALDIVARYFDVFWKLLDRSVFFIGGGLILLAGGYALERQRQRLVGQLTRPPGAPPAPGTP